MPTVPIVRVPWNDQVHVKQALDVGADGVLAPMVRSAAEARALVAAAKYPPDGIRGFGPRRASDYGRNIDAYVARRERGLDRDPADRGRRRGRAIDEILAVPGSTRCASARTICRAAPGCSVSTTIRWCAARSTGS